MNIRDELIKYGAVTPKNSLPCVLACEVGYLYVFENSPNELGIAFYDNRVGFGLNVQIPTQIDSAISLLGGVKQ